jgi:hypothetical protein
LAEAPVVDALAEFLADFPPVTRDVATAALVQGGVKQEEA